MILPETAGLFQSVATLRRTLQENPDLTIEELREALEVLMGAVDDLNSAINMLRETLGGG